jgi:cephalosporin hydroxylase
MKEHYINKYLTHDIRYHNSSDDRDTPDYWTDTALKELEKFTGEYLYREFSDCNQYALINEFLKVKDKTKVIVEIGVARLSGSVLYEHTSTTILINNKNDDTIYIGIDVEDKKFLEKEKPNVHTIQARSEDYETIKQKFDELGIKQIDFLFVDGWHSVNQVIDELFYVDYVPAGGVIGYHDTNFHPGPSRIINALKPEMFDVRRHCINKIDWGTGFATRK